MTAATGPRRVRALREVGIGVAAVGVKELRGRMRGRRAFVILTIHLLVVAGFAWMMETLGERAYASSFSSNPSASADIGRELFASLIMLLTLIVLVLAPASTAGAISLEREKQTLDLLTTTPISSLAIVLGKLLSALSWVLLLLLASIPVTALVFTFGGVGPDDVVRAYVVLLGTAVAFGSIGLFVSALVKRTQAATVINLVTTITVTVGATIVFVFWSVMTQNGLLPNPAARDTSPLAALTRRPPEALLYLNPFVTQLDVICGTETGVGTTCSIIDAVTGNNVQRIAPDVVSQRLDVLRDTYWPRALIAMVVLSIVLVIASVQLVSPTRRWRIRRRRRPPPETAS